MRRGETNAVSRGGSLVPGSNARLNRAAQKQGEYVSGIEALTGQRWPAKAFTTNRN